MSIKLLMKRCLAVMALSLISFALVAEDAPPNFATVEELISKLKQWSVETTIPSHEQTAVNYDSNGAIAAVTLAPSFCTDRNVQLLGQIKSLRYLLICCSGHLSTNSIPTLAAFPNLTGLGLVCCSGPGHLVPQLPCLT